MASSEIMDLFRAAVQEDSETVDRLSEKIGEDNWPAIAGRIAAVFGLAVQRKFGPDSDVRAIVAFVAEARAELAEGDDIPPLEAEALVRAALGESELAENISQDVAVPAQIVLAVKILRDEHLSGKEVDQLLAEADALAKRWGA
jgi:hypothetical protein